jgi:drug/metabolite transporter (DMT)-like permease
VPRYAVFEEAHKQLQIRREMGALTMSRTAALWMTFVVVLMVVAGQIMFKLVANRSVALSQAGFVAHWLSWQFFAALSIYGVATILWIWVLRFVPLNVAYPIYALAFVILPLATYFLYGEPLGWRHLIGGVLIVTGVVVITRS